MYVPVFICTHEFRLILAWLQCDLESPLRFLQNLVEYSDLFEPFMEKLSFILHSSTLGVK